MGNVCSPSFSCDASLSRCLDCSLRRARYVYDLQENLDALWRELEMLKAIREDVKMRILVAEQKQIRRREQVQVWLSRVQDVESQVAEMICQRYEEVEKLCLGGVCSVNCMSSYKFAKKVFRKLSEVQGLVTQGDRFKDEDVAQLVPVNSVDELPLPPTIVGLQSTFDSVWRCLMEEQLGIVGLYGIGGVGKTTLLTLINNKFLDTPNEFDFVIWVVVSKDLQLEKIQETIADKIGLLKDREAWDRKSCPEKAQEIFKIMRNKKYVLLFDDIWEPVDLAQVGLCVPSRTCSAFNKVIFTTRELDVCSQMETHKNFKVECLSYENAWKLFEEKVSSDTLDSHLDIPELAETVAKECGGLPLALITVGRAMTSKKTPREWEHAVDVLRSSASKFSGMVNRVFFRLKLRYDFLSSDATRIGLLYCSLFPEDHRISIEDLIDCWICEDFLDEYDGIRARQEGYSIIRTLVDACLLEEIGDDALKMHDVIRDMALWIASTNDTEKETFVVLTGGGFRNIPRIDIWKDVTRMSLMNNKIYDLGESTASPRLMTLFLSDNNLNCSGMSSNFFQSLAYPSLKVLKLSNCGELQNLLVGISKLVLLRHLDLSNSKIRELPLEFRYLVNLKCLNLEHTYYIRRISSQVISNLKMLQSLRMFGCGSNFLTQEEDSILHEDNSRVLIDELLGLEHLDTVTLTLRSFEAVEKLLKSKAVSQTTHICFRNCGRDFQSLFVFSVASLRQLQTLEFASCHSVEIMSDYRGRVKEIRDIRGFLSLQEVVVQQCRMVKHLTWLTLIPNLKFLHVSHCNELEEIISCEELGELATVEEIEIHPFGRLESLFLYDCEELKSIHSVALLFPHLKEIFVEMCPGLKKLPFDCKITAASPERKIVIEGTEEWWNELQWDDEATAHALIPFFKPIEY